MGIFDMMFRKGSLRIPPRRRASSLANLARGILATQGGTAPGNWNTAPTNLAALTDEVRDTHLTQDGINGDVQEVYIEVDLGEVHEVYEININNIHVAGQGFMKAAGAAQDMFLVTGDAGETAATGTIRGTQVLAGDGDWHNSTLRFQGNGIPVRYAWLRFENVDAQNINVDISEIEVLGV